MTSRITELDRPRRFVDEQARGPFLSFRHEHLFARRDNRTAMTDRVQFKAPVGVIGFAVERFLLEWYLRRFIAARGASWMVVSAAQPG
jgi:ligand-binding SRPBCC domain-containing protein